MACGLPVEAELGTVGGKEDGMEAKPQYTDPDEAADFVSRTGISSFAVAIGTAHGVYKAKAIPEISFKALSEIRAAVDTPLVLHGGSGSGDDNLRRCAREGICKVNVYTDLYLAAMAAAAQAKAGDYLALRNALKRGMSDCLKHYYSVFETRRIK